jgi:hypothetical protein
MRRVESIERTPADTLKSGHEVEEQRWLVNGDRTPPPLSAWHLKDRNGRTGEATGPGALPAHCTSNRRECTGGKLPPAREAEKSGLLCSGRLVLRGFRRSQFFNLVLECQLASLEIHDLEVVDRWMVHRVIDFSLDVAVFPLQLIKMGCKRHDWISLSWFPRLQPSQLVHRRSVL